ncbi:hypothetical protein Sango_0405000 [Sesamum angolense]|uniref:Uncharacterized protein n=1 Tax=Sesamum angolense TaxID=2727404 RepID=A0AAE1XAH7_9LAMI|nr:hypothetical protein Sango_0405000 [Sesamum angolense]
MAGDFNRSPNSFNFDFGREAKNSLLKLKERYLVPVNPSAERTKSAKRHQWKRSLGELNGKFDPNYRHRLSSLIIQSYSEADWFNNVGFNHNPRSIRRESHHSNMTPRELDGSSCRNASRSRIANLSRSPSHRMNEYFDGMCLPN